jgi:hypothetical protein
METSDTSKILEFNDNSLNHFNETRKWTLFISIIGFIFIGVCIVIIPVLIVSSGGEGVLKGGAITTMPIVLVVLLYFFPIYWLLKFSIYSKRAIHNSDGQHLESSLKFLKYHYRFMGILIIICIAVYIIAGIAFLFSHFIR